MFTTGNEYSQGMITRVYVIRTVTLDLISLLFPTASDPDILIWTNQHSLPSHKCNFVLGDRMTVNIMCVGQPLKTMSEIKVSFLSPGRKTARGL